MDVLDVFELYADASESKLKNFEKKLSSNMEVKLESEKPKTELPVFDKHPPVSAPQPTPYPTKTTSAYGAETLGIKLEPTAAPAVNLEKPIQEPAPQPEEVSTLEQINQHN